MGKWEFMSVELMHGSERHIAILADLGNDGWDLVAVVPLGQMHVAYLKRPCP